MKIFLALVLVALVPSQSFACEESVIQANVQEFAAQTVGVYRNHFVVAVNHGILEPGEHMNIEIYRENFFWDNKLDFPILVASLYGSNVIGDTIWIAELDPRSCSVVSARQVIGADGMGM